MDRLTFFNLITGIRYPEMLIEFYDQFLALKQLVNGYPCTIDVCNSTDRSISFNIDCDANTVNYIAMNKSMIIYGRSISIYSEPLSDKQIRVTLQ